MGYHYENNFKLYCFCNLSFKSKYISVKCQGVLENCGPVQNLTKYREKISRPHTNSDYSLYGLSPCTKGSRIECYLKLHTSHKDWLTEIRNEKMDTLHITLWHIYNAALFSLSHVILVHKTRDSLFSRATRFLTTLKIMIKTLPTSANDFQFKWFHISK